MTEDSVTAIDRDAGCTLEEFQAMAVELIDKVDRQGRDLGRRDAQLEAQERRIRELNDALQTAVAERQNADAALEIACRTAHEAQGNYLLAEKARGELAKTVSLLESKVIQLRSQLDARLGGLP